MKSLLLFTVFASTLLMLAAIATGLMISISSGHTSWLLTSVFAFDTLLLIAVAGRLMLGRHDRAAGRSTGES